jgi:magnesium chelatase subunit D
VPDEDAAQDRGIAAWADACLAACLFGSDPFGTGLHLRASPGPVRDRFLSLLPAFRRCPAGISQERLWGGLDLAATLAAGRTVAARGLLAEADGSIVVVGSAERMESGVAARLGAVLDDGEVRTERDGTSLQHAARIGLVLLDEGRDDEAPPASLLDRMAFRVELDEIRLADATSPAPYSMSPDEVVVSPEMMAALCSTADALGIFSARAPLLALRVTRALAAIEGRSVATEDDASMAARLVFRHRATRRPAPMEPDETEDDQTPSDEPRSDGADADPGQGETLDEGPGDAETDEDGEQDAGEMADAVLAAALASLPPGLLTGEAKAASGQAGRAGANQAGIRGRPLAARAGRPGSGARLALIDTLRAAVPWQKFRVRRTGARLAIRGSDLRVRRFETRSRTTALFVVDASGSAAMNRLAEAKGAVELLLADCYVRRDQVALIAFRGNGAELLLPPTGALARAKRCLASLPGGGATPLSAGLDLARATGSALKRRGEAPLVVVLTDGKANVARDGTASRSMAMADALASAASLRGAGLASIVIDISPRAQFGTRGAAFTLADAMGGRCVMLPRLDAAALSQVVRQAA